MSRLFAAYKEAFRIWIRERTRPYSIEEAEEKQLFWARAYVITAWTTMGVLTYYVVNQNIAFPLRQDLPKNVATAVQHVKDQPVRFVSFDGFKKLEDFTYSKEEMQKLAETKVKPEKPNPSVPNSNNSKTQS